jgi:predicted MFS family arabinose efflux permease
MTASADAPHGGLPEQETGSWRAASWRVLRNRRFAGYFAGSLLSNLGTWVQNTAQILLAYQLTHSALAVGLVSCAQFAGFLVLGPWSAAIGRRVGGKRLLVTTQLTSAAVAAWMALSEQDHLLTEPLLLVGALVIGFSFSLALPVQMAMIPRLIPDSETPAALAMNSVCYNAGRTLAPALAIIVLVSADDAVAFAINAVSFAVFAAVVLVIYPGERSDSRLKPQQRGQRRHRPDRVLATRVAFLLLMVAAVTLAEDPVSVLGPTVARQVLDVSRIWPAWFLFALGLGTILGSLLPIRTGSRQRTQSRAALSLAALAIAVVVFVSSHLVWLTISAAVVAGAAGLLTGVTAQSLLLVTAPPESATQVLSWWAIAWAGTSIRGPGSCLASAGPGGSGPVRAAPPESTQPGDHRRRQPARDLAPAKSLDQPHRYLAA